MDLRVKRGEFLAELLPMQGIVERRTTIPVLSHLLLAAKDERLAIAATDLDVSLTSSCEAQVKKEGAVAVQAKKFIEIIRSLTADEVKLTLDENQSLVISAGGSRFKIHGLQAQDFPTLPDVSKEKAFEIPFGQLRRMIGRILFAVSSEESRFQLNGALLKMKNKALELVATDGHRLALVENEAAGAKEAEGVLVPRKALQELQRFESGDPEAALRFRRGEHHLSFQLGRRELICRILEGTFPDYERVIAKDNERKAVFERKVLAEGVRRVAILTGDRARAVRLEFSADTLVITAANPDLGEAREELACEYKGGEIRLGINPDYLDQFLQAVDSDKVRLEMKDENTQCVGVPVDGSDQRYLCVIMPMRI
jgi:DNA polymerase III subunit beta